MRRDDLFSFGLVLYELASGKRAFAGDTAALVHQAILDQTPPAIRILNPAIPSRLESIIDKAIQKNLVTRYQTASEMKADLQKMLTEKTGVRARGGLDSGSRSFLSSLRASGSPERNERS
jgi:eukaryotic-like serine/threonine-protein kinase